MSVLIKGMEMPKNCGSCPLRRINENRAWCYRTGEYIDFNKEFDGRKNNCPLIEVPTPHGSLVDREELIAEYDRRHKGPAGGARRIMEQATAIIKAEE